MVVRISSTLQMWSVSLAAIAGERFCHRRLISQTSYLPDTSRCERPRLYTMSSQAQEVSYISTSLENQIGSFGSLTRNEKTSKLHKWALITKLRL